MATRFKDFGTPESNQEPLSFALFGETFECRPSLQGKFLLELVSESKSEDPSAAALVMQKFFDTVLTEESLKKFNNLAEDPNRIVSVETLSDITAWLVEEYSARPTRLPEPSPSGQ